MTLIFRYVLFKSLSFSSEPPHFIEYSYPSKNDSVSCRFRNFLWQGILHYGEFCIDSTYFSKTYLPYWTLLGLNPCNTPSWILLELSFRTLFETTKFSVVHWSRSSESTCIRTSVMKLVLRLMCCSLNILLLITDATISLSSTSDMHDHLNDHQMIKVHIIYINTPRQGLPDLSSWPTMTISLMCSLMYVYTITKCTPLNIR